MVCPKCASREVHRSHAHNIYESTFKVFGLYRIYRCDDCGWRGWRRVRGVMPTREKPKQFILYGLVVAISLFFAYLLKSLVLR
jgi:predicted RNA-binding Zn-ribbon protein involved in translation (DUF1610 family)